jgi:putative inorganic carbon (hco3(-)) transporter
VYYFREERERERMFWLLIGCLAIISLYGLWQFETKPWMGSGVPEGRKYYLIQSLLSSEVWLTTYLVMLIPLCVAVAVIATARWQRVLAAGSASLAVLCQLLTFSRSGLLALLVEAVVWAVIVRKRIVTVLVIGCVLFIGAAAVVLVAVDRNRSLAFIPGQAKLTTYNLESRLKVWSLGFAKLQESPLVGIGYGKDNFYWATKDEPAHRAAELEDVPMASGLHNTFLDIAVGAGLPAGLAYLWLMWALAKAGWVKFHAQPENVLSALPRALLVMVAGVFVRNCFDHMWIGTMALLFWVVVALSLQPMTRLERAQSS